MNELLNSSPWLFTDSENSEDISYPQSNSQPSEKNTAQYPCLTDIWTNMTDNNSFNNTNNETNKNFTTESKASIRNNSTVLSWQNVLVNITNNTDDHILNSFNNTNCGINKHFIPEKPSILLNAMNDSENIRPNLSQPIFSMCQRKWTKEEDRLLIQLCSQSLDSNRDWFKISKHFHDRQRCSIKDRWDKVLNPNLVKGNFTKKEDAIIIELVAKWGSDKRWKLISKYLPGRLGN